MNLTCQVQTQVPNFYVSFTISTETAPLKVHNVIPNMDNQRVILLVLLDEVLHSTQSTTRCCSSDWNLALEYLGQHCAGLNHTSLVDLSASVLKAATPRSSIYPMVPLKVHTSVPYFSQYTLASCSK